MSRMAGRRAGPSQRTCVQSIRQKPLRNTPRVPCRTWRARLITPQAIAAPPPPAPPPLAADKPQRASGGGSAAASALPPPQLPPVPGSAAAAASAPMAEPAPAHRGARGPGSSAPNWELKTGLAVTWLGTSSGAPTLVRNVSCTLVRMPQRVFLVDCGEGTHRQLLQTGIDLNQVEAIFVTHLHGDHCFGLASMLASLCAARAAASAAAAANAANTANGTSSSASSSIVSEASSFSGGELRVYGPPGLGELLRALLSVAGGERALNLPLTITEFVMAESEAQLPTAVDARGMIRVARLAPQPAPTVPGLERRLQQHGSGVDLSDLRTWFVAAPGLVWSVPCGGGVTVSAAQLQHRVPCWGFAFQEAGSGGSGDMATAGNTAAQPSSTSAGDARAPTAAGAAAASSSGSAPGTAAATAPAAPIAGDGRKVVVLGDTINSTAMAPLAAGADMLAHEATFRRGMEPLALRAQHSTAWMAGRYAAAVGVHTLVLTHFSARYHGAERSERVGGDERGGNRAGRGGGRGGGPWRVRASENDAGLEAAAQARAVDGLVEEAAAAFPGGKVFAAKDFWTFHVPQRAHPASQPLHRAQDPAPL